MKTILLVCACFICVHIFSQSIVSDKKSNNVRTIITGSNPLYKSFSKTIQVRSQLSLKSDSITSYELSFTAPELSTTNNATATSNSCLLQTDNGKTFTGVSNNVSSNNRQSLYTYKFSKEDLYKIIQSKINQIKITTNGKEALLSLDANAQTLIAKQAQLMLAQLKQ